jgi:uncharacterized protein
MVNKLKKPYSQLILLLLGVYLLFDLVSHLTAEILWFNEVGYLQVFWLRLTTKLWLWTITFLSATAFLLANLTFAKHLKYGERGKGKGDDISVFASKHTAASIGIKLKLLLPVVVILSILVELILIYLGQETAKVLYPIELSAGTFEFPLKFSKWLQQIWLFFGFKQISIPILQGILLLGLTPIILTFLEFSLYAQALLMSIFLAFIFSAHWDRILQFFHAINFNRTEPLFHRDISFYVFSLPIWRLLELYLLGIFLYSLVAAALIYLRSANSLSEGSFPGFTVAQRLHLNALACLLMLSVALRYWLLRYSLLYEKRGVNYGASYTAVKIQLPIYTVLTWLAIAITVYLFLRTIVLFRAVQRSKIGQKQTISAGIPPTTVKLIPYPPHLVYALTVYIIIAAISGKILPSLIQRFLVQPNELVQERPYIERTIALTRQAFNLTDIETQTFAPEGTLTAADLQKNASTISNIRLWDTNPLLRTNRQLQQIRPYYKFAGADIDRYTLREKNESDKQQTIIAARELDYTGVPAQAKTWVNEHLVYTHGYGFTLSPVNQVGAGGLPDYYVKDIGVEAGNEGSLQISSPRIRESIPINRPRIYFGEITNNYVITGTKTKELDYPSGNDNVYNVYDGRGGISIHSMWQRLLFAQYLKDWQMLLTRNFTPQTKLLFRRNIQQRVEEIAPFLHYDSDPYLVAADGGGTTLKGENTYLYWIIDAYTTSDRYPYSDPGNQNFNYIRNSVKVIVDAYNGNVNFYITDSSDPIITSFNAIFPGLFKPLEAIPNALGNHLRYPVDLFSIQSERLLTYHMTDPQVFYNREDLWQIPTEIYGTKPRSVEPYYLITKLPKAESEEFILLLPFTPTQRPNLIAWLAARSDGSEYGKLLLYKFPKQQLVYGQEQIEALINQDPVISQQITLWNREGSHVTQGNLLIIPIEKSLLYVEPLYLEAEQNSVPTLIRVVVAYENRIVMAQTLEQALAGIFQPTTPATPAIVRPVE